MTLLTPLFTGHDRELHSGYMMYSMNKVVIQYDGLWKKHRFSLFGNSPSKSSQWQALTFYRGNVIIESDGICLSSCHVTVVETGRVILRGNITVRRIACQGYPCIVIPHEIVIITCLTHGRNVLCFRKWTSSTAVIASDATSFFFSPLFRVKIWKGSKDDVILILLHDVSWIWVYLR